MNNYLKILTMFFILSLSSVFFAQGETSISSTVDKNEITIGDRINYTVTIRRPKSSTIITPPVASNLGMFEIQDFDMSETVDEADGSVSENINYRISTFTAGDYVIPPTGILVQHEDGHSDTLITQPITIKVLSLLEGKDPDELDIRGIKAPLEYPPDRKWLYFWLAVALIIVSIVLFYIYWRRRRSEGIGFFNFSAPPKPPYVIAFERLEQMKGIRYHNFPEAKSYFIEISEILREYIESSFDVPALEMTTYQTIEALKQANIRTSLTINVNSVLEISDMVKFAKFMPSADDGFIAIEKIYEFVNATKPKETIPPSDAVVDELPNNQGTTPLVPNEKEAK